MASSVLVSVTLTVWAAADSGVLCIGVRLLDLLTLTVWAAADSGVLCVGVCNTYRVGGG